MSGTLASALTAELQAPDPFPVYRRLREEVPVAWNEAGGYWVLSKHADVAAVSNDTETFCSRQGILTFEIGVEYRSPPTIMHTDPPDHTRDRKLIEPGFRPSIVRGLEQAVRRRVTSMIGEVDPSAPVDFVDALAVPLPLQVISELLGIPAGDWPRFFRWSEAAIPGANDWSAETRAALQAEMVEYLVATARSRRRSPGIDLISILAGVGENGDRLTDAELAMFSVQLLVAGNETTRNLLSGGMIALADHPEQWDRLTSEPSVIPLAVEEMLRWTTPVIYFMRTATRDTTIRGTTIAQGDPVVLLYASANRDPDEFGPTADRFDVTRTPNRHLAFGFGAHFCIGAALARLEARVVLQELTARFSAVRPAGTVERTNSPIIAGIRHVPLAFTAR